MAMVSTVTNNPELGPILTSSTEKASPVTAALVKRWHAIAQARVQLANVVEQFKAQVAQAEQQLTKAIGASENIEMMLMDECNATKAREKALLKAVEDTEMPPVQSLPLPTGGFIPGKS